MGGHPIQSKSSSSFVVVVVRRQRERECSEPRHPTHAHKVLSTNRHRARAGVAHHALHRMGVRERAAQATHTRQARHLHLQHRVQVHAPHTSHTSHAAHPVHPTHAHLVHLGHLREPHLLRGIRERGGVGHREGVLLLLRGLLLRGLVAWGGGGGEHGRLGAGAERGVLVGGGRAGGDGGCLGALHGLKLLEELVINIIPWNAVGMTHLVVREVLQQRSTSRMGVEDAQHLLARLREELLSVTRVRDGLPFLRVAGNGR